MSWSKLKQSLESFLSPNLSERLKYSASSYRYTPDKAGICYITVDNKNILNMKDTTTSIRWFSSEQEIKSDSELYIPVFEEDIEAVRKQMNDKVPEERLKIIARDRKLNMYAKEMLTVQAALSKSNFTKVATTFLSKSIEDSLESDDILLNIFAIIDRRVGKKRLLNMKSDIKLKHPAVQYFYELRLGD